MEVAWEAEIGGVKLSPDLPKETVAAIQAALIDHKVIFFRDQDHLDDAQQEGLALLFGTPEAHPFAAIHADNLYRSASERRIVAQVRFRRVRGCYPLIRIPGRA